VSIAGVPFDSCQELHGQLTSAHYLYILCVLNFSEGLAAWQLHQKTYKQRSKMKQNYHNNNNYKPSVHYKHAHTPLHITLTTLQKNNHVSEVHCGSFFWWVCVYARHLSLTKSTSTQKKKERTKRKGGKRRWKMRGKGGERRKARDIRKREGDGFRGVEGCG